MGEYEIDNYAPSDQHDLVCFFRAALGELGFDFDPDTKDQDLQQIPAIYQSSGGLFLLAKHMGRIIGTIALRPLGSRICELKRFYVLEEFRRNGIGRGLLTDVLAHARRGAWDAIRLDTSYKSPAAIALFRVNGFVEIHRYNDDPFADVFMELRLGKNENL